SVVDGNIRDQAIELAGAVEAPPADGAIRGDGLAPRRAIDLADRLGLAVDIQLVGGEIAVGEHGRDMDPRIGLDRRYRHAIYVSVLGIESEVAGHGRDVDVVLVEAEGVTRSSKPVHPELDCRRCS